MPCIFQIDSRKRVIRSIYSGIVSFGDVQDQRFVIGATDGARQADFLVIDLTNVLRLNITADEVYSLAKSFGPLSKTAKHIFVAPRAEHYGIARMYQIMGQEHHPNTFVVRSREEADALL